MCSTHTLGHILLWFLLKCVSLPLLDTHFPHFFLIMCFKLSFGHTFSSGFSYNVFQLLYWTHILLRFLLKCVSAPLLDTHSPQFSLKMCFTLSLGHTFSSLFSYNVSHPFPWTHILLRFLLKCASLPLLDTHSAPVSPKMCFNSSLGHTFRSVFF